MKWFSYFHWFIKIHLKKIAFWFGHSHLITKDKRWTGSYTYFILFRARSQMVKAHVSVCGEIDRDLYNRSCVEIDTYELLSGICIRLVLSSLHMRARHCQIAIYPFLCQTSAYSNKHTCNESHMWAFGEIARKRRTNCEYRSNELGNSCGEWWSQQKRLN